MTGPPRPCAARGRPYVSLACRRVDRYRAPGSWLPSQHRPRSSSTEQRRASVRACTMNHPTARGAHRLRGQAGCVVRPAAWSGRSLAHSVGSPATLKPQRARIGLIDCFAPPLYRPRPTRWQAPGWTTSPPRRSPRASATEIRASVRHCGRCTGHLGPVLEGTIVSRGLVARGRPLQLGTNWKHPSCIRIRRPPRGPHSPGRRT